MGIFLIILFITVIGFVLGKIYVDGVGDSEALCAISGFLSAVGVLAILATIIIGISAHTNVEGKAEALECERAALVYQLDNCLYMNDNNVGSIELFDKIGGFNSAIVKGRAASDNFMTNIYTSPKWWRVDPIDLSEY